MTAIPMPKIVFCLEERSAEAFLRSYLPRLFPKLYALGFSPIFLVFEGKSDLEKRIEKRLRGWIDPETQFVVMRDQDSGDCIAIKARLVTKCTDAGRPNSLVRIACQELESWYLGELAAVDNAFKRTNLAKLQFKANYREPDGLGNPKFELRKLTDQAYQPVAGSREIGRCASLDPTISKSTSFRVFFNGLTNLLVPAIESAEALDALTAGEEPE